MNSKFMIKLALTTAFVALPSFVSSTVAVSSDMKASPVQATAKKAHSWARKAEKAIVKGKLDKALMYSELAVEGDMMNRDYRALLARVYMAQGRFSSAERTYMDLVDLGQVDPRTVISLALTRIAQGKVESAVALVDAHRSIIPASDYGLTLALAGKSDQAVELLSEAIRQDNATARTRQNLALAYALSGRWREARIMAVQDMPQDRVNQRITEWAQYARPGAYETRVAGLLKVTPQQDSGQPIRLALSNVSNGLASAAVADEPQVAVAAATQELAAVGEAPASMLKGFDAVAENNTAMSVAPQVATIKQVDVPASVSASAPMAEAPLIRALAGPAKSASKVEAKEPVKLALSTQEPKAPVSRSVSGTHLVQLGAFSSTANAKKAWEQLTNRHSVLTGFNSASSSVKVNGKTLIRLAAMGFGSQKSANDLCNSIKAKGGSCIVRSVSGPAPVRLASR
jgi:D-alanyl-D-alanine carboxypeptidase